ncbi:zinc finger C-x8-C-x5-C-x3-H type family protein isoform X2 [Carex rostrata]
MRHVSLDSVHRIIFKQKIHGQCTPVLGPPLTTPHCHLALSRYTIKTAPRQIFPRSLLFAGNALPSPSISAEAQESHRDDSLIHLVPLTAIEDDDPSDLFDSQSVQSEPSLSISNQSNSVLHPHPTTAPPPAQVPPSSVSSGPTLADMSKMLSRLGSHADVAAATAAAITALTSAEQGNLIDQNLLIKILSDPSLIEMLLTTENQKPNPKPPQPATASMPLSAPLPVPPPLPSPQHSAQLFNSANDPNPRATRPVVPTTASGPLPPLPPQPMHHNVPLFNSMRNTNANPRPPQPMVTNTVSASLPPPPPRPHMIPQFSGVRTTMVGSVATPPPPPPPQIITTTIRSSASVTPAKDASYYLSLIKQHGGDNLGSTNSLIQQHGGENLGSTKSLIKQHGGENLGSTNPDVTAIGAGAGAVQFKGQQHGFSGTREGTKSKMKKTCAFYNTARGCRHGDNCSYLHENSMNSRDERAKKRVKLDSNGIVGRT